MGRLVGRRSLLGTLVTTGLAMLVPTPARGDKRARARPGEVNPLVGKWTYRSFLRDPDINKPFNDLEFARAELLIQPANFGLLKGRLTFGEDGLALNGTITFGNPFTARFQGVGDSAGTRGWIYDYLGFLSPAWPNGVEERPALVGTIVRTVPHSEGKAKAGVVASWIAVKQDSPK